LRCDGNWRMRILSMVVPTILPTGRNSYAVCKKEVIELEDLKAGVSITDLGLNDFRMDLLQLRQDPGRLSRLPNGLHAVLA